MRIVKFLSWLILALALVVVLGGLLLPSRFHVERSTLVSAPPERVYSLVVSPRLWKEWTVWNRRDPAMKITYFGPEQGSGAGWEWQSANEGDGKMTLTAVTPSQRVGYELYFPDMASTTQGELRFVVEGQGTRVTWMMDGDMGRNPLMRWMGVAMDRMVGPDFDSGLANLKTLAERSTP